MNTSRFLRLLRQDLHLLRRHGAVTSITIFTVLISLLVLWLYSEAAGELGSTPIAQQTVEEQFESLSLLMTLNNSFPGGEFSWKGMTAVIVYIRTLPFCLPLLLVVLTARVVANPIKTHAMREDLVRPISRDWLLAVRFASLSIASLASLFLCVVLGLLFSAILGLGPIHQDFVAAGWESPPVSALMTGIGLVWITDMAVIGIAMLLSLLVQPTGRVFLLLVLCYVSEAIFRTSLNIYAELVGDRGEWATELAKWLPGQAMDAWMQWPEEAPDPGPMVATALILLGTLVLSGIRFRRMDIT